MQPRVALVTGAGSGIGRAVAIALAGAGYAVALAGRRTEPLQETANLASGKTLVLSVDVTDAAAVASMVDADGCEVRPPRRAVQQRRSRRAPHAHRRAAA